MGQPKSGGGGGLTPLPSITTQRPGPPHGLVLSVAPRAVCASHGQACGSVLCQSGPVPLVGFFATPAAHVAHSGGCSRSSLAASPCCFAAVPGWGLGLVVNGLRPRMHQRHDRCLGSEPFSALLYLRAHITGGGRAGSLYATPPQPPPPPLGF